METVIEIKTIREGIVVGLVIGFFMIGVLSFMIGMLSFII